MLLNFKSKTQGSYVCGLKHYYQDIQVSNIVALVGAIDAGVTSGGF